MAKLKINFQELFVYNLSGSEKVGTRATSIFNYYIGSLHITYLGLPIKPTSLTKEDWQLLIERIEKRLANWKSNALSQGDRLILVNFILSSMSLYYMSFYLLPDLVIHAIVRIRHAFFWKGTRSMHRGFCLINRQLICSHKNQGSLDICNLETFNLALLSK